VLPGGYKIPKDSVILPALHHIHNNPDLWDNPNLDFLQGKVEPNAHTWAHSEWDIGSLVSALDLIFRYKFTREGNEPIEYDPMFQLIRPNNLYVRAEKREDKLRKENLDFLQGKVEPNAHTWAHSEWDIGSLVWLTSCFREGTRSPRTRSFSRRYTTSTTTLIYGIILISLTWAHSEWDIGSLVSALDLISVPAVGVKLIRIIP
jgi:hypothetical protein